MSKESKGYAIQQEYADKRRRTLHKNDDEKTAAVREVVDALRMKHNRPSHRESDWLKTYKEISDSLRAADLTINIEAASWLKQQNVYQSYAQMYQRAVGSGGEMILKDYKFQKADDRARVDDQVTLPEQWGSAHPFSQRKRLWKAMSATGSSTPKNSDGHSTPIEGNKLRKVGAGDGQGFKTTNRKFKPAREAGIRRPELRRAAAWVQHHVRLQLHQAEI